MIDQWGHYRVADGCYANKLKAFDAAFSIGHIPHWDFYESEFDKHDWTQEPAAHLRELYRARAWSIRDSTDYIILLFSGGADSWTIANSFVANGILIDEIWSMAPFDWLQPDSADKSPHNTCNEVRFTSIPEAEKFLALSPKTKYRVIPTGDAIIDFWSKNVLDPESVNHFAVESPIRDFPDSFFSPTVPKNAHRVRLVGLDKPRVCYQQGRFYFYFLDEIMWSRLGNTRSKDQDELSYDMAFYWHPESAPILIKQGHLIKQWFKAHPELMHLLSFPNSHSNNKQYQSIVNRLIYPDYHHDSVWQCAKESQLWDLEGFSTFARNDASAATANWKKTILRYSDAVNEMYRCHNRSEDTVVAVKSNDWHQMLPGCFSKFYDLGT
jgi:hypothetical protein